MHKFDVSKMNKLDNPRRRELLPPEEILQKLKLEKGEVFADIGCGIGYFSIPAARIAGETGTVYALDIAPQMLQVVAEKAEQEGLANIKPVQCEEYDFVLPEAAAATVFTCNVLHEVPDQYRFLSEMKRLLKKEGKMVIIDWEKVQSDYGPPIEHRIDKEEVRSRLEKLGFKELTIDSIHGYFYMITARNGKDLQAE